MTTLFHHIREDGPSILWYDTYTHYSRFIWTKGGANFKPTTGSSHFFGIGIYPVSDTAGIGIFWSVLLYYKLWREHIFKFSRELFFWKILREFLFSSKEGWSVQRGGRGPPFLGKRGAPANFVRGSRQIFDTENTDRVFLRYRYGKYREIATYTDRKIPRQYFTFVLMWVLP